MTNSDTPAAFRIIRQIYTKTGIDTYASSAFPPDVLKTPGLVWFVVQKNRPIRGEENYENISSRIYVSDTVISGKEMEKYKEMSLEEYAAAVGDKGSEFFGKKNFSQYTVSDWSRFGGDMREPDTVAVALTAHGPMAVGEKHVVCTSEGKVIWPLDYNQPKSENAEEYAVLLSLGGRRPETIFLKESADSIRKIVEKRESESIWADITAEIDTVLEEIFKTPGFNAETSDRVYLEICRQRYITLGSGLFRINVTWDTDEESYIRPRLSNENKPVVIGFFHEGAYLTREKISKEAYEKLQKIVDRGPPQDGPSSLLMAAAFAECVVDVYKHNRPALLNDTMYEGLLSILNEQGRFDFTDEMDAVHVAQSLKQMRHTRHLELRSLEELRERLSMPQSAPTKTHPSYRT